MNRFLQRDSGDDLDEMHFLIMISLVIGIVSFAMCLIYCFCRCKKTHRRVNEFHKIHRTAETNLAIAPPLEEKILNIGETPLLEEKILDHQIEISEDKNNQNYEEINKKIPVSDTPYYRF